MTFSIRSLTAAALVAAALTGGAATAQDATLLSVTDANGAELKSYDLAALKALGTASFETTTIWTEGKQRFTGVPLTALFKDIGVTQGEVNAIAVNDYSVPIPVTDAVEGGPLLAFEVNGAAMSVRDKGPLWIVYPYDSKTDYQSETIYSRSIWQLNRLQLAQ
jgi:hypothetical protein